MKTFKIEVPNGYEIDKEKSTFENIVFKKVKKQLPETFEELCFINGFWINGYNRAEIQNADARDKSCISNAIQVFATKEQAEASLALAQLSQLREVYRNGWKPDWTNYDSKYCIDFKDNKIKKEIYYNTSVFLSFQDKETCDLFFENFRNLIEQAKPLMS
jgi:hypothetical protein